MGGGGGKEGWEGGMFESFVWEGEQLERSTPVKQQGGPWGSLWTGAKVGHPLLSQGGAFIHCS